MGNFSNSASRVLNVLEKLDGKVPGDSALVIWSKALGIDENISKEDPFELQRKLGLLKTEFDLLESSMASTRFSENLYKPYISRIKKVVSISNLDSPWGNYHHLLGVDVTLCLKFCSEILPNEPNVNFKELEELLNKLKAFREEIEQANLPFHTYQFVNSQIDIIESAILDFPIKGGSVIRRAFSAGFSDINEKANDLANDEVTEVTSKVGGLWKDLKKAGDEFVGADRIVNAYVGLITKGQSLASNVISFLPGNGI